MKFIHCLIFLFVVITVGSEIIQEERSEKSKLPLLLKTLRLRTFSLRDGKYDYVPEVQVKQLRLRPTIFKSGSTLEDVQDDDMDSEEQELPVMRNIKRRSTMDLEDDVEEEERSNSKLPGWGMIGKNRHPNIHNKQLRLRPTNINNDDSAIEEGEQSSVRNIQRRSVDDPEDTTEEEDSLNEDISRRKLVGRHRLPKNYEKHLRVDSPIIDNEDFTFEELEEREHPVGRTVERRSVDNQEGAEERRYHNLRNLERKEFDIDVNAKGKNFRVAEDIDGKNFKIHKDFEGGEFNIEGDIEGDEDEIKNRNLPGWGMIGGHHHPKVFRHKVLPYPVPRLDKRMRRPFWKHHINCSDNHLNELRKCFAGYFENFEITLVGDKLPSIVDVHEQMARFDNYEQNKGFHGAFKTCYSRVPKKCFESKNLKKIIVNPDEKNVYSSFFTFSEFIFKDQKYEKDIDCFLENMESLPSIEEEDTEEEKIEKCRKGNLEIQKARDQYRKKCMPSELETIPESQEIPEPQEASEFMRNPKFSRHPKHSRHHRGHRHRPNGMDEWFIPFIKRQSIGEFCPPLFTNKKALPFRIY